jgi:hypothetical protein
MTFEEALTMPAMTCSNSATFDNLQTKWKRSPMARKPDALEVRARELCLAAGIEPDSRRGEGVGPTAKRGRGIIAAYA